MADKVLNFIEKRKENIEKKRRSFERVMFQNVLGAYSVIDKEGVIYPVELVDISHDGCQFQVPWDLKGDKKIAQGTEVPLRMYFTDKSFIPVVVKVKHCSEVIGTNGTTFLSYGCEFDKELPSFQTMKNFIDFLYSFAEHSTIDNGDIRSYFL